MKRMILAISSCLILLIFGLVYLYQAKSIPTITYFPLDERSAFESATTSIRLSKNSTDSTYYLNWEIESKTDKSMYLRQDISLLFANGKLQGVRSKWIQDTASIYQQELVEGYGDILWETISFHHGEIHYPANTIKSIQQLSKDHEYVFKTNQEHYTSFKQPNTEMENQIKQQLDRTTKQQLLSKWNRLLHRFQIDRNDYMIVPLTNVAMYQHRPLPSFTSKETDQIIGKLWEGLYKNYIIPTTNIKGKQLNSYIPLVLFSNKHDHLLVLYELNGNEEKLLQKYPDFK